MSAAFLVRQRKYNAPSKRRCGKLTWSPWATTSRHASQDEAISKAKRGDWSGGGVAVFFEGRLVWPK